MSVIVGIVRDGKVHMGADSFEGHSGSKNRSRVPKLFRIGEAVVGFSGDTTVHNALMYRMTAPEHSEDETNDHYMAVQFVDAMRAAIEEAGQLRKKEEKENAAVWILVGYRGCLYTIYSDFSMSANDRSYEAMGAGQDLALGTLHELHGRMNLSSKEILKRALDAACEHSPWCIPPYVMETV